MQENTPETMRAVVINNFGGPEVLQLEQRPVPVPVVSEVLVRVVAAGVNPIDGKTRSGKGVAAGISGFPVTLGWDFSGVIERAAYEAHPLQPGTEVYGMLNVPRTSGSYAEYAAAPILSVTPKPQSLSHIEAAAVPLAALTALGAIETAQIEAGQRVLVQAGAGGVGHFAVQFAALLGAEVVTTASQRNAEWLRELGASDVIDYRSTRFEDVLDGVDAVIDLMGNVVDDIGSRSLAVMKPGGIIVNVPTGSWPSRIADAAAAGMRATGYTVTADAVKLAEITQLVDAGRLVVHVDAVFPLSSAAEAHTQLEQGHTRGKIVLQIID